MFSTKSSLLRGTMRLRKNVVPHFLALSDSTQDLVRALQALAAAGKPDEAEAILREEVKIAPTDAALQNLLHSFVN